MDYEQKFDAAGIASSDGDREGLSEVNRVARILLAAWEEAEGRPVGVSYVSTFADMARAVTADTAVRLAEVTAERDELAAEVNSLTADWDHEHARADALAEQVAAVEALIQPAYPTEADETYGTNGWVEPIPAEDIIAALADPGSVLAARDAKVAAQAWDRGYSCGLGDCGKDRQRETVAANPYWQRAAGGEVE